MWKNIVASIVISLLAAGAAFPRAEDPAGAKARLKAAWNLKKTSFKQEPDIKKDILLKTVDCYRSLLRDFAECKTECSEACFRMGEIYRSLKMTDEAVREFERTFTFDPSGVFAARSLKEIGHVHRRAKNYEKAIAFYQRVLDECPDQREQCADAYTWIGKVHLKMKQYDEAGALFIGFVEKFPEFPDDALRSIDLAAGALLDQGKRQEAADLLNHWRQHFESLMGRDKRLDKKIEKALEGMKTPERLKE